MCVCVSPLSTIDGTPELQSKAFVGELQATLYGVNAWFLTPNSWNVTTTQALRLFNDIVTIDYC